KALGVVTKETGHAEDAAHTFHTAFRGIGRLFPELGHLAHAVLNPIALAIVAIVTVLHRVVEGFKEMGKVLALPVWEKNTETWKSYETGLNQATASAQIFQFTLAGIADTNALLQKSANDAAAALQRQANAQIAIRNAQEALDLAKIDA